MIRALIEIESGLNLDVVGVDPSRDRGLQERGEVRAAGADRDTLQNQTAFDADEGGVDPLLEGAAGQVERP